MYTFEQYLKREAVFSTLLDKLQGNKKLADIVFGNVVGNFRCKYNNIVKRRKRNKAAKRSRRINRLKG